METHAFAHQALLYDGVDAYVREVGRFVHDGLKRGEHVMVCAAPERLALLRDELGDAARDVDLADAATLYARNGPMFSGLIDYLRRHGTPGTGRVRVVSEAPLGGRAPAEVRSYLRYEAVANVAFSPFAATVACPYDVDRLPDAVIAHAMEAHPEVLRDGRSQPSPSHVEPAAFVRRLVAYEPVPVDAVSQPLDRLEDLAGARALIRARAGAAGLEHDGVEDLLVAANEVAENALLHGVAPRRLWCWADDGAVVCRVSDAGAGLRDPLAGYLPPGTSEQHGRGLWLAGQLCDAVEVAGGGAGTDVTLRLRAGRMY